ncbi:MAG: ABC transporter ATP-binding protein [Oligoflexales bacterium]|nr:ABC transporter ATP-binding protein [Oligoflexales bacterium]
MIKVMNKFDLCFGTSKILSQIELELAEGSLTALIGKNGSGKTSLLKCLTGFYPYLNASILVGPELKPLSEFDPTQRAKTIAWLATNQQLAFDFTVEEIVAMGRYPWSKGYLSHHDKQLIENSLQQLDLQKLRRKRIFSLSSGEQQRVYIARIFAQDTPIIFLDEPFANLDLCYSLEFFDLLNALKDKGKTIVLSIHDLHFVQQNFKKALVMQQGKVLIHDDIEQCFRNEVLNKAFELYASPSSPVQALSLQRVHPRDVST